MADSDKNIVITPNRSQTAQPKIVFTGKGNDPITIFIDDASTGEVTSITAGASLSVEGSAGQLFSITDRLATGSIFSVNDISGIPSINVDASGLVELAPFGGGLSSGYIKAKGLNVVNELVFNNGTKRSAEISFANGNVQILGGTASGTTGATAIFFSNPPATGAASVALIITNGGTMTGNGQTAWASNIRWPGGVKPVLTVSGVDVISFVTPDAGSTIYGFVGGLNFS